MTEQSTINFIYNIDDNSNPYNYIVNIFSKQIEYINSALIGDKISTKKAKKRIKKIYKNYKKLCEILENDNEINI